MKTQISITAASWEPRFILGSKKLAYNSFSHVYCFNFIEDSEKTKSARDEFRDIFQSTSKILSIELSLHSDKEIDSRKISAHAETWKKIKHLFETELLDANSFILDITTMPREGSSRNFVAEMANAVRLPHSA